MQLEFSKEELVEVMYFLARARRVLKLLQKKSPSPVLLRLCQDVERVFDLVSAAISAAIPTTPWEV